MLKPSTQNGKGGRGFVAFLLHFKAWLNTKEYGAVLDANFDNKLPNTESEFSMLLVTADGSRELTEIAKAKLIALNQNLKAM